jgi:predicted PurR-regulated permease PerM
MNWTLVQCVGPKANCDRAWLHVQWGTHLTQNSTMPVERLLGLALLALILIGSVVIILPVLPGLVLALIFAVSTWGLFLRLEHALKQRTGLAAAVLTLIFAVLFLVPLVVTGISIAEEVPRLVNGIRQVIESGPLPPPAWLRDVPFAGPRLEASWINFVGDANALVHAAWPYIGKAADFAASTAAQLGAAILQILVALLVLFFLYRDGRALSRRAHIMVRKISGEYGIRLLRVATATMRSVVYGILGAAVIQGVLAMFGLWISGVPGYVFLGVACILLAMIPVGLIMLVLLPAAGWLFYSGSSGWGTFLLLWSVLVVAQVDNFIRPVLISRGANLPVVVILIGIVGGLAVGGILGIFVGATLLGVLYTVIREWSAVQEEDSRAVELAPLHENLTSASVLRSHVSVER